MYYPLSQITPNQYTNGGEFKLKSTGQDYIGYYFITSTGKYFTGRNQNDTPVEELFQVTVEAFTDPSISPNEIQLPEVITITDYTYNNIIPKPLSVLFKPVYNPNIPTQQDYQIGEYRRYFCKKVNEIIYIEIDKTTFDKLVNQADDIQWSLYQPFDIPWNIVGSKEQVAKVNRDIVLLTMKNLNLPSFDQYLKFDFTKYLKN